MDLDPIKQLQSLLADRGKVLEKISSIHSALGSIKTDSAAPEPESPPATAVQPQTTANPYFENHAYGRLLQAVRDMQAQIEERVRPLAEQVVECEVARLREQSSHYQTTLNACLAQIDQCILNCVGEIDAYQNQHAVLVGLNERIMRLGGAPEPVPDSLKLENFFAAMQTRVAGLGQRGKL